MQISQKDKKMLIVLGVFLAAIVYYLFILTPLSDMNTAAQKSLVAKRKELLIVKTKLSGLVGYKKKINDLKEVICITEKEYNMPDITEKLNNKMKAVTSAANKASVKISSLKPMNVISEKKDGTVQTIKDKYISIDGKSDISSFLKFLQNLWGTELEEIEVSSTSRGGESLQFYIKVAFLPKIMYKIKPDPDMSYPAIQFGVKNNIFSIIKPPRSERPVRRALPPSKPVHQLNNATLLGIAEFGAIKMAILEDGIKKETDFFLVGDHFRDATVLKVTKNSVVFKYPDGDTLSLHLPKEKKYYSIDSASSKKKGHLGILAETLTEELAREKGMDFKPGLLVISSGAHDDVLHKGDIISSINGQPVSSFEDALNIMKSVYSGEEIKLTIFRADKMLSVKYKAD